MPKNRIEFAVALCGPVRIEKRAIDAVEFLRRKQERKRNEIHRKQLRAAKTVAADAFFKL